MKIGTQFSRIDARLVNFGALLLGVSVIAIVLVWVQQQPVALDWRRGDLLFLSERGAPGSTDGPFYLLNVRSKRVSAVKGSLPHSNFGIAPSWSSDGKAAAFVDMLDEGEGVGEASPFYQLMGIVVMDGRGARRMLCAMCSVPAWSPDGTAIAYYAEGTEMGTLSLRVARLDGSEVRDVVSPISIASLGSGLSNVRIAWSRNGEWLAYDQKDAQGGWYVWMAPAAGGEPRLLRAGHRPAWSPQEDVLAYDRDGGIWLFTLADGSERPLTPSTDATPLSEGDMWPTWSPDGKRLAFVSQRDGNLELYVIGSDGADLQRLTRHQGWDAFPAWRP